MYNRSGIWQSESGRDATDPASAQAEARIQEVRQQEGRNLPTLTDSETGTTYFCVPLETVPTEVPLPCSLYVRIGERFILFRKQGDSLSHARAESLREPGHGVIFLSLEEWNRLLHSLETLYITAHQATQVDAQLAQGTQVRNLLLAYTRQVEISQSFTPGLLRKLEGLALHLATLIHDDLSLSDRLLRRYQDPALYYVNHAVNVAIYSVAVGKKQGLRPRDLGQLALASLVHNVGNIMVPAGLLYRPGELTPEEKASVDSHILHGGTLLQGAQAPKDAVLTAMQHHDRFDGKGLGPGRKGGESIHLFARICSIADVYDALTSCRPHYNQPLKPLEAVERMRLMRGKFDPRILPMVTPEQP